MGRHDEEECVKCLEHVSWFIWHKYKKREIYFYFYFAAEILIIDPYYYYLFSFNKYLRVSRENSQLLSPFSSLLAISCDPSIKYVSAKQI